MSEKQPVRIGYTKHAFMRTGLHGKWEPQVSRLSAQKGNARLLLPAQQHKVVRVNKNYQHIPCARNTPRPYKNTRYKSILTRLLRTWCLEVSINNSIESDTFNLSAETLTDSRHENAVQRLMPAEAKQLQKNHE